MLFCQDAVIYVSGQAFEKEEKLWPKSDSKCDVQTHKCRFSGHVRGLPMRQRHRICNVLRDRGCGQTRRRVRMSCLLRKALPVKRKSRMREEPRIRAIRLPKGKSLGKLTQESVGFAFGSINSLVRAENGDQTPIEAAERVFGKAFLEAIGVKKIDKRKSD